MNNDTLSWVDIDPWAGYIRCYSIRTKGIDYHTYLGYTASNTAYYGLNTLVLLQEILCRKLKITYYGLVD
jgi:hypothetical protein